MFKGKTRDEDLFKSFDDFKRKSNLSYDKIVSIYTDEVSTIVRKEKGIAKRNPGQ